MTFEFFIAFRYLKAKRKEGFISLISFLSVSGIALGVMALVVVIAVMSGAETDFRNRILGLEPHMLLMNYEGNFSNVSSIVDGLNQIPEIVAVSPILYEQAMLRSASGFSGAMIRGIDPDNSMNLIKNFSPEQLNHRLAVTDETEFPGIILGKELAKAIGVVRGEKLLLISPKGLISPLGPIPSMKRFQLTDIFDSGMYEYDSSLAYIHLSEAQKISGGIDKISAMGIWVKDVFEVKMIKTSILEHLKYPFYVRDWMEINQSLFSALKLEKTAMFIILTLIILVAAFNIASALIMMVMEKTKDIAVLKTMGASNQQIRKIFIVEGMVIGVVGTIIGTITGVVACVLLKKYKFIHLPEAYPFSTLPVQLEALDVISITAAALVICFFSTLYPSYKASKMNTVEALRYG